MNWLYKIPMFRTLYKYVNRRIIKKLRIIFEAIVKDKDFKYAGYEVMKLQSFPNSTVLKALTHLTAKGYETNIFEFTNGKQRERVVVISNNPKTYISGVVHMLSMLNLPSSMKNNILNDAITSMEKHGVYIDTETLKQFA